MKKEAFSPVIAMLAIIMVSAAASAEIVINQQPEEVYSLGEKIAVPMTVTSSDGIYDFLQMSLICDSKEQKFPEETVDLAANEAKKIEKSILLMKKFISDLHGTCRIKAHFKDKPSDYVFSNQFKISNSVNISLEEGVKEFNPGDSVSVKGTARKENGENVNGFLELALVMADQSGDRMHYETVSGGSFSLNFSIPERAKSGQYLVRIKIYEKDPLGEMSNNGFTNYNIFVKQVPTSLEIVFESRNMDPGKDLRAKSVLHDQTGEKINSTAIMTIKNSNSKILEQREIATDEFLAFPIAYNEMPSNWTVVSVSNKISANSTFMIIPKESASVDVINKTVAVTNTGNVPYNETLLVRIGNATANINAYLKVDESKRYTLSAPDGRYDVEIVSNGKIKATGNVILTGDSVEVRENSASQIAKSPFVLIFITLVLGFMAFMIFRKGYKKSFLGYIPPPRAKAGEKSQEKGKMPVSKEFLESVVDTGSVTNPKNKAELSMALQGEKQSASMVCLRIKNFNEFQRGGGGTKELFDKIGSIVVEGKGFIYESQGNFFYLFIPSITRTFRNERKAVEIAQEIENQMASHNKLFKQKLDFGISVNYGDIITKKEAQSLKFMGFGNFLNISKKIASLANNEVYLSDAMGKKLMPEIKAERLTIQGIDVYKIRELKEKKEEHQRFLRQFVKKLESDERKIGL